MTDCKNFEEMLPAYLEETVSSAERQEIEHHLESCDHCRSVLRDLKKTAELLAGLEEREPPPWFRQQIMARVKEVAEGKKGWLRKLFFPLHIKVPIEALATLIIGVLAWQIYQASPPEMKISPEAPSSGQIRRQGTVAKETGKPIPAAVTPAPEGKPVARDSKDMEPAIQAESHAERAGGGKRKEEWIAAAKSAGAHREEKEDRTGGQETAGLSILPLKKAEPADTKSAQAPALQAAPRGPEGRLKNEDASGELKLNALQDRAQVLGKATLGQQSPSVTVLVRDAGQAADAVYGLLKQIKAENIREEIQAGRKTISALVQGEAIQDLFARMRSLGEVSPSKVPPRAEGKAILIRIEIVPVTP